MVAIRLAVDDLSADRSCGTLDEYYYATDPPSGASGNLENPLLPKPARPTALAKQCDHAAHRYLSCPGSGLHRLLDLRVSLSAEQASSDAKG